MRLYENDIQTTLIENYSRNSGNREDSSNGKGKDNNVWEDQVKKGKRRETHVDAAAGGWRSSD